ncbi:MAG: hypothetical protein AAF623_15995 [Planctomycetota bacterium]
MNQAHKLLTTLLILFVIVIGSTISHAQVPISQNLKKSNPLYTNWAKFKPGTSVTLLTKVSNQGRELSSNQQRMTLQSVSESEVEIDVVTSAVLAGKPMTGSTMKIRYSKFLTDQESAVGEESTINSKVSTGKDKLNLFNMDLACQWTKTVTEVSGTSTTIKNWTCDNIPGLTVKSSAEMAGGISTETTLVEVDIQK